MNVKKNVFKLFSERALFLHSYVWSQGDRRGLILALFRMKNWTLPKCFLTNAYMLWQFLTVEHYAAAKNEEQKGKIFKTYSLSHLSSLLFKLI